MKNALLQTCRPFAVTLFAGVLLAVAGCGDSGDEKNKTQDSGLSVDYGYDPHAKLTSEKLFEACLRLGACGIERHPFLQECANNFNQRYTAYGQGPLFTALYNCVNSGGGDCKVIRECVGFAGRPVSCDDGYKPRCENGVAYNCDLIAGWEYGVDCTRGGLECAIKKTGETGQSQAAICGGGECVAGQYEPECNEKRLQKCVGGAIEINDCAAQGLQCRDPEVGECEGVGRSCAPAEAKCKGNVLVECVNGYAREVDCAALPGEKVCDPVTQSCKGYGTECSTDSDWDTCEGDNLVVCIDGFQQTYDCKGMGFIGCEKAELYGAYCKAEPVYE